MLTHDAYLSAIFQSQIRIKLAVLATLSATILVAVLSDPVGSASDKKRLLDVKAVRSEVRSAVEQAFPGHEVGAARCPRRIPRRAGLRTECRIALDAVTLTVAVTQLDRSGNVSIEPTQAVIPKPQAEQFVSESSSLPAQVDCGPDPLIVRPPGTSFWCTVRFEEGTVQQVLLAVQDTAGTVMIVQTL